MTRAGGTFLLLATAFCGCRTAENVAETSAAVVTAPAHFVSKKLRGDEATTTETTDTTIYETQPVETLPPPPQPTPVRSPRAITAAATASSSSPAAAATPRPSLSPRVSSTTTTATQFPVAKPVPGKPGYVFSPYDPNGGYVDVTGYASGSKVKDPYSQKIFLVP